MRKRLESWCWMHLHSNPSTAMGSSFLPEPYSSRREVSKERTVIRCPLDVVLQNPHHIHPFGYRRAPHEVLVGRDSFLWVAGINLEPKRARRTQEADMFDFCPPCTDTYMGACRASRSGSQ